ncbi:unnamed protein product [Bursaphelenchus xylophilus]|uniref:(pine wood nematode) hypothetical protein n=1 Tax=Bursaphelenchus xylophilus TaxID=6326 RepID=A0A1I7S4X4_BURXY|nr:unnamed protein product [Bursaphelenchus xylophilus]CAG9117470.1 unnamed protein product [Bursaphelenchus xylophilus]
MNATEFILENVEYFRVIYGVPMLVTTTISTVVHAAVINAIIRLKLHRKSPVFRLMFTIELNAFLQIFLFMFFSSVSVFDINAPYFLLKPLSIAMTNLLLTMSCQQICLTFERIWALKDVYSKTKISMTKINIIILFCWLTASFLQSLYFTTTNDYVWYRHLLQFKKFCCDNEFVFFTENLRKVGSVCEVTGNVIVIGLIFYHKRHYKTGSLPREFEVRLIIQNMSLSILLLFPTNYVTLTNTGIPFIVHFVQFAWIVVLSAQPILLILSDVRIWRYCLNFFEIGRRSNQHSTTTISVMSRK